MRGTLDEEKDSSFGETMCEKVTERYERYEQMVQRRGGRGKVQSDHRHQGPRVGVPDELLY